jgi:HAE1 family hydrophobic/amphiphilic exporter-1
MRLSEICIRRPVFTWVLIGIPVVLGIAALFQLGVDLFPKVDFPVVAVTATFPGASAEEMEANVTELIENAVNAIAGVEELESTSREGSTTVIVQFSLNKNGDVGAQEVRDKIAMLGGAFPQGMDPPVVNKFDIDATPIMTIGISGRRDIREISEIARRQIQEPLQTVSGVGSVFISGGQTRAINVVVDTDQLASYNISIDDVRRAVVAQNLEVPGGLVDQGERELTLRTLGRVTRPEQFEDLIVAERGGFPIRIRDIGRVEDSIEEQRSDSRLNGRDSVSLFVQKQSGTNTVEISNAVHRRLAKIIPGLPADIQLEVINDQSRFIRKSLNEIRFHLMLAAFLVSATILLFIRDWRTTVIATLAIPTSIVPTFFFMQQMGFTLNNMTMLALLLSIGIVIDDAVVVHENIFRRMEEFGESGMEAARAGTKEISLAVLATSLSLLVIFIPVAFMGGIVGRFFSSFGFTVAFAIVMSLFVSFTLTPMLCSRFLKLDEFRSGSGHSKSGALYRGTEASFGWLLRKGLRHRWITAGVCVLVFFATIPIARIIGANFVPRDDQSEFQVKFTMPEGYTLARTNRVVSEMEQRLLQLPGIQLHFTVIGEGGGIDETQGDVTRGSMYFRIKELHEREYSQFDVMARARLILQDFPDVRTAVNDVSAIGGGSGDTRTFRVSLKGPDLDKLDEYSSRLLAEMKKIPGLVDVDTTLSLRKPEIQVEIDRDRASDLNIPVQTIADTLSILVGGKSISKYREGSEQYEVWLRADKPFRAAARTLSSITIPSPTAGPVQLSSVVHLREARGPSQIQRENRQRTVELLALPENVSLKDATVRVRQIVADMNMDPGYEIDFGGQADMLNETGIYFAIALGLSLLFMYLILAAQFESWLHPISILASLPVTIPFGLLSLMLFRTPLDLYSMFGLFMLIGIVKKNGILQVDKTNELRRGGMPMNQAILEANHVRLRPILMTTVMLIAAMLPIALGQGAGAGARASMAKVIIGGQALSLVLALLVTPVAYSLLEGFKARLSRLFRKRVPPPSPGRDVTTIPHAEPIDVSVEPTVAARRLGPEGAT